MQTSKFLPVCKMNTSIKNSPYSILACRVMCNIKKWYLCCKMSFHFQNKSKHIILKKMGKEKVINHYSFVLTFNTVFDFHGKTA